MLIRYDDLIVLHFLLTPEEDHIDMEWRKITSWADDLKLAINPNKSCIMNVTANSNFPFCDFSFVESVSKIKFLGCIISEDLKWNSHIDFVVKKVSKRIFLILNLRRADCEPCWIYRAYCAFIRSVMLYAYPAMCNMPEYLKNKLIRIENRMKRIFGADVFHKSLSLVGDQICQNLVRNVISDVHHPLRTFFKSRISRTRNKCPLMRPKIRTQRYGKTFIKYCP